MDICVLNPFFYPYNGGTERVLYNIYGNLAKKHNITVISAALKRGQKRQINYINNIKVVRLNTVYLNIQGLPMPFLKMNGILDEIKKTGAEIYHINNRYQYFLGEVKAVRSIGGKLAITIHNSLPRNIDRFTDSGGLIFDKTWGSRLIGMCDLITAVSKDAAKSTVPKKHLYRTKVILNGVDYKEFRPRKINLARRKLGIDLGNTVILNTARLVQQKGQIYLIDAFDKLISKGVIDGNSELIIIGSGPLKSSLQAEVDRRGLHANVSILSNIEETVLPYYYNSSNAFVFPSLYEPAGLAGLEALASGIPVVATRVGGIPEMLKTYGIYVSPRSSMQIFRAIKRLSETGWKANNMRLVRDFILKEHDWKKIAKQYEVAFENTLRH
ncbi:MAG: glycosyltransferase family 4 protein [Candidatus Micrarchaeaceae archaeon]